MAALELLGRAVRAVREKRGTTSSKSGLAALERVQDNIDAAKAAKTRAVEPEIKEGAIDEPAPAGESEFVEGPFARKRKDTDTMEMFSKAETVGASQMAILREALADPEKMKEINDLQRSQAEYRRKPGDDEAGRKGPAETGPAAFDKSQLPDDLDKLNDLRNQFITRLDEIWESQALFVLTPIEVSG